MFSADFLGNLHLIYLYWFQFKCLTFKGWEDHVTTVPQIVEIDGRLANGNSFGHTLSGPFDDCETANFLRFCYCSCEILGFLCSAPGEEEPTSSSVAVSSQHASGCRLETFMNYTICVGCVGFIWPCGVPYVWEMFKFQACWPLKVEDTPIIVTPIMTSWLRTS